MRVDDAFNAPLPTDAERQTIELEVLRKVASAAGPKVRKTVVVELLKDARAFKDPERPGHALWYPIKLQLAAWAVRNLLDD